LISEEDLLENTAGRLLAGSIEEVANMSHQVDFRLERAVELFPEECHHRFSPQERFEGTEVVSCGKKARMFPTLPEDDGDLWTGRMIPDALRMPEIAV
jgi:hypothetical protein